MPSLDMVIAENIKRQLIKHSKKQTELAEAMGICKQTVTKILNCSRHVNAKELHVIANFFNVPMEEFVKPVSLDPWDTIAVKNLSNYVLLDSSKKSVNIAGEIADMIIVQKTIRGGNEIITVNIDLGDQINEVDVDGPVFR